MYRYRMIVEYDGLPYVGWQRQDNGPSVQAALEKAIFTFSREEVVVGGAGRTDVGVHALGQVAQFTLSKDWDPNKIFLAINGLLREHGDTVAVLSVDRIKDPEWDVRFSATHRYYLYRILNRLPPPTVTANQVWWVRLGLDAEAMHEAAQLLVGLHDFTTFRSTQCQSKSPVKTLSTLDVKQVGDEIHITAGARSFLHNQIRSLAGTLKLVGAGKWTNDDVLAALAAKDRKACAPVAPSRGLYFMKVEY